MAPGKLGLSGAICMRAGGVMLRIVNPSRA